MIDQQKCWIGITIPWPVQHEWMMKHPQHHSCPVLKHRYFITTISRMLTASKSKAPHGNQQPCHVFVPSSSVTLKDLTFFQRQQVQATNRGEWTPLHAKQQGNASAKQQPVKSDSLVVRQPVPPSQPRQQLCHHHERQSVRHVHALWLQLKPCSTMRGGGQVLV
jgi:hypothetical protein